MNAPSTLFQFILFVTFLILFENHKNNIDDAADSMSWVFQESGQSIIIKSFNFMILLTLILYFLE